MDVRRLKTVEQENARLKKFLAGRDLEIEVEGDRAGKIPGAPERRRAGAICRATESCRDAHAC